VTLSDSGVEIFIELISFFFIMVEKECLENNGGNKEEFAYKSNESHI
jgi:hypothetical protein